MTEGNKDILAGIKILLISPMSLKRNLIIYYLHEVAGGECRSMDDLAELSEISTSDYDVILWDVCMLKLMQIVAYLRRYYSDTLTPLALVDLDPHYAIEPIAFRLRVRGFFYNGNPVSILPKGTKLIVQGHIWAPREVLEKCLITEVDPEVFISGKNMILTNRQEEVLRLIVYGYQNAEIAEELNLSLNTVKAHLYQLYKKIKVKSRWQAAKWAEANIL